MKGSDGLCTDCGCTHDLWHAENPTEWEYREGCLCYLCQEQERKMSRDTQFQNFAKLLFEELQAIEVEGLKNNWNNLDVYRRQREAIARRAYDLARHAALHIDEQACDVLGFEDAMQRIPDMTELPKDRQNLSGSQFEQEYLGKFVE